MLLYSKINFDLLLVSYLLDNSENSNDLGLLAQQHEYYDVESDEQIYGKGAKHAVPKDKEVLFEHLVRKVKAINNLKEKLFNELEENQQTVKKSGFGRGLIFGVIAGLSVAILAGCCSFKCFLSQRICPYRRKW